MKTPIKRAFITGLFILTALVSAGYLLGESSSPLPNDVKWVRYSIEYPALCIQTYRAAWQSVKQQAAQLQEDWAVVLDIDETVLDNSRYQEILHEQQKDYPYYWDEWVLREECPPVPGVRAFLDSVRNLGKYAHVVYITNRKQKLEAATLSNLKKTGLWQEGDLLLCRIDRSDTKEIRRQEVINGTGRCEGMGPRRIIALIGDQLADFMEYPPNGKVLDQKEALIASPGWGVSYFVLPNPMYGYWVQGYQ